MSPTLERAREIIEQLSVTEQCELTAYLNQRLNPDPENEDAEVAAAWDEEIAQRAQAVMDGSVELIPAAVVDRNMRALLAASTEQKASA